MDVILFCNQSGNSDWKVIVPIFTAILVFIFNVIYQNHKRKLEIRDRLSNEIIETCDKMIRYAASAEVNILEHRYYYLHSKIVDNDILKKEEAEYVNYYHKKAEDSYLKYDLLKADLKKNVKDLKIYWGNPTMSNKIISIMAEAVIMPLRDFMLHFTEEEKKDITLFEKKHKETRDNITDYVILNGVGFNLVRIQKIIDPDSPSLYLRACLNFIQ
jgi:hypothetical protein